jgi:hypothetical protein
MIYKNLYETWSVFSGLIKRDTGKLDEELNQI